MGFQAESIGVGACECKFGLFSWAGLANRMQAAWVPQGPFAPAMLGGVTYNMSRASHSTGVHTQRYWQHDKDPYLRNGRRHRRR